MLFYLAIARITKVSSKYADDNLLIWRKDRGFRDGGDVRGGELIVMNQPLVFENYY